MKAFLSAILAIESLCAVPEEYKFPERALQQIESSPDIETSTYPYLKISDQWGICPGIGIGIRGHDGHHGFDTDFSAYSYWDAGASIYGKGHYLFYPTKDHFYLGIGAGVIGGTFSIYRYFYSDSFIKPTIEASLGYEWGKESPCFLQLEVGGSYGEVPLYPQLSFGIGF